MTCLQDTYWWVAKVQALNSTLNKNNNNFTIIHAIVERRSDGVRHPHAVIHRKDTNEIYEVSNGNKLKLPYPIWVVGGNVDNIKHYTFNEIHEELMRTKVWKFYHLKDWLNQDGIIHHGDMERGSFSFLPTRGQKRDCDDFASLLLLPGIRSIINL